MEFKNIENKKYNVTDNGVEKEIYHNRAVTMNVIQFVVQQLEDEISMYVLVVERGPAAHDYIGKLNLPCGHLDWNETVEEGASREMYEETGFYNTDLQILGVNSDINNNRQNVQVVLLGITELEKNASLPELIGTEESVNPRWLKFDELLGNLAEEKHDFDAWAFKHDILIFQIAKDYFGL